MHASAVGKCGRLSNAVAMLLLVWLALFAAAAVQAAKAGEPAAAAAPDGGRRIALVIGNARYPAIPLTNPENDARVVASTLRRLGFSVSEHVNLPIKEFRRVLRSFAKQVQGNDGPSVLYYAGHGVQIEGRNYLLPVDINLRDEDEIRDEGVDIDELFLSRLERAQSQVRIVILDACRDNPFSNNKTRGLRGAGGLAEMAAHGALIAYATAPGATAEDGPPGTNSIFTRHLATEMLAEGVEVEQMFKRVRVKVMRDTEQRQVPWVNTSMTTNFSFNPAHGPSRDDIARREDLARLQALLEQREREQKLLEQQLEQLNRRLAGSGRSDAKGEVAQAAKPAASSAAAAAAPAAPVAPAAPAPPAAVTAKIEQRPPPSASTAAKPASNLLKAEPPSLASAPAAATSAATAAAAKAERPSSPAPVAAAAGAAPPDGHKPESAPVATAAATAPKTPAKKASQALAAAAPAPAASAPVKAARTAPASPPAAAVARKSTPPQPAGQADLELAKATRPVHRERSNNGSGDRAEPTVRPTVLQPPQKIVEARASTRQGDSERCVALLIRAQLGEAIRPAEMAYLKKECH